MSGEDGDNNTSSNRSNANNSMLEICLAGGVGLGGATATASRSDIFFRDFWQKKPLHCAGNPNRFLEAPGARFSLGDLEFLWATAMKVDPDNILFFDRGTPCTVLRSAFFAFAHNVSVVVNKADRLSPAVLRICEAFEKAAFPFCYCNCYSTPAGSQTVPAHSDDRDVFILQVHGSKHWIVQDSPVPLPYKFEEVGKKKNNDNKNSTLNDDEDENDDDGDVSTKRTKKAPWTEKDSADKVTFEGVLHQGDVLYLPRGYVHVAKALPGAPSVHLTIAVQTSDWDVASLLQDGMHAAIDSVLRSDASKEAGTDAAAIRTVLPPNMLAKSNALVDAPPPPSSSSSPPSEEAASLAIAEKKYNRQLADEFSREQEFLAQMKRATQAVLKQLENNPHGAIKRFRSRMQTRRQARQEFYDEHIDRLRFFPLTASSLLLWNGQIRIVGAGDIPDEAVKRKLGSISVSVSLQKQLAASASSGSSSEVDAMSLQVSPLVLEVMAAWSKNFTRCPGQLGEMMQLIPFAASSGDVRNHSNSTLLQCICIASFLLRNGCMVRVN